MIAGLEGLRSPADLAETVFYSYVSWMLEASTYWLVSFAFNLNVAYPAMLLVVGVVNLAGLDPGVAGAVRRLRVSSACWRWARSASTKRRRPPYALVNHLVIWLPVTLVGFYFLIRRGLRTRTP